MKSFKEIFAKEAEELKELEPRVGLRSFKEYLGIKEDAVPTNTTSGIANSDPGNGAFKKTKFAGIDCIEVDHDTYSKFHFGKKPFARWSGIIEDEKLRDYIKSNFHKSKKLMIRNSSTGSMIYLKR